MLAPGTNNFVITHDDGFEFDIAGPPGIEISVPGPTAPIPVPFAINNPNAVSTQFNFAFSHGEVLGGPAQITVFGGSLQPVPAPGAVALLGLDLAALGLRRRAR